MRSSDTKCFRVWNGRPNAGELIAEVMLAIEMGADM